MQRHRVTPEHLAALRRKGHPLPIQNMLSERDAADWLLLLEALGICEPTRHPAAQADPVNS
jgi:hypothetical protein